MKSSQLLKFAETIAPFSLQPWQLRVLRDMDTYYAKAEAKGISREEASRLLSERMKEATGSLTYSSAEAIRDASLALNQSGITKPFR